VLLDLLVPQEVQVLLDLLVPQEVQVLLDLLVPQAQLVQQVFKEILVPQVLLDLLVPQEVLVLLDLLVQPVLPEVLEPLVWDLAQYIPPSVMPQMDH
jgi:hypothetical protein